MSLNAKHMCFPSSSLWYSPKKSAETRTDLIKGNFIDIASTKFGVKLHGSVKSARHFLPFPYQGWGIVKATSYFVIHNMLFTLNFLITPNITKIKPELINIP